MPDFVTLIGLAAAALAAVAFLPQVVKTWKSRSAKDISLRMLLVLLLETFLWIIYGVYIDSFPVVISNLVTMALVTIMLIFKIRYK